MPGLACMMAGVGRRLEELDWGRTLNSILDFIKWTAAAAKSLQSCPTLCDPIDGSPPGSPRPWDFPRQEQWCGLPFPSPMHESEK